jgi:hypothetical protein
MRFLGQDSTVSRQGLVGCPCRLHTCNLVCLLRTTCLRYVVHSLTAQETPLCAFCHRWRINLTTEPFPGNGGFTFTYLSNCCLALAPHVILLLSDVSLISVCKLNANSLFILYIFWAYLLPLSVHSLHPVPFISFALPSFLANRPKHFE